MTDAIDPLVDEALQWIRAMRDVDPVTVSDVEEQRAMSAEADKALERVSIIADAIVGKALPRRGPDLHRSTSDWKVCPWECGRRWIRAAPRWSDSRSGQACAMTRPTTWTRIGLR